MDKALLNELMLARIEEAEQDEQALKNLVKVGTLTGGSLVGAMAGVPVQAVRTLVKGKAPMLKPGYRMAGGLVGAMLGGALGPAIAERAVAEAPEARLLAKVNLGSDLTESDLYAIESMLADSYNKMFA